MPSSTHQDILTKLEKLSSGVENLATCVKHLDERMEKIEHDTGDVIGTFTALQGGFKVLQWIGKLAAPVAAVGTAWASFKAGMWK